MKNRFTAVPTAVVEPIVDELEKALSRAKNGEIVGLILIAETRESFEFRRYNLRPEVVLGLATRLTHMTNTQWDATK